MTSITIPYAVADFVEMRERGFYYVDKTKYIAKLEAYNAPIFLRPRRFGKSLFISTLACYYDRTKTERFDELFGGTWIGDHPTSERNQYMIVRYDFSAMVMAKDIENLEQNFNDLNCSPVEIMVEHNRDLFGDFQFNTRGNASKMLEDVLSYARAHGLPKVYPLIDEYDNFINQLLTAYNDPLYEQVTTSDSFLRTFFKVIKAGIGEGSIPEELVDENLRTDINWIRRLTLSLDNAKAMLDALVIDDELSYNVADLSSKFNKQKFFDKEFYPISLFYPGITTLKNNYRMTLPNMTMHSVYMDYYNQLNRIEGNTQRYVPTYERYDADRRIEPLVQNYFEQYLGQFSAQVFDKINENFIRCSFYELVSRYLSSCYTFAIEQNNTAGRSDFEMTGIPGTDYYTDDQVIEFKYFKAREAEKMLECTEPREEDVEQVRRYADDTQRKFPNYKGAMWCIFVLIRDGNVGK